MIHYHYNQLKAAKLLSLFYLLHYNLRIPEHLISHSSLDLIVDSGAYRYP